MPAIEVARRPPALVLCDLVVTGLGEEELDVTCLEHGANDYVNKPVDQRELIARIQLQLRLSSRRVGYHPASCGCGLAGCSASRC